LRRLSSRGKSNKVITISSNRTEPPPPPWLGPGVESAGVDWSARVLRTGCAWRCWAEAVSMIAIFSRDVARIKLFISLILAIRNWVFEAFEALERK